MNDSELTRYITLYRAAVFRAAFSYVKNREDAEDISQETFARLFVSRDSFRADENVKAWLIRVAINLAKNLLKSSRYRLRDELPENLAANPPETEDAIMHDCIRRLPPEYSSVIYLFYYEGYSVKEIAALCKISSAAVRTRLSRGRNRLKEMLLKEDNYEAEN